MTFTRLFTPVCFTIMMLVRCIQPSTSPSKQSDDETAIIKSAVTYLNNMDWLPTDETRDKLRFNPSQSIIVMT